MTETQSVLFSTLEQVVSGDVNRAQALMGKALHDRLLALLAGISTGTAPRDVTLRGLNATVGAGLTVNIEAGDLLRFNAGAAAEESQYRLATLITAQALVLAAADPVNPRVDTISIVEASLDTDGQVRNILTLPGRVVVPVLVNKTRRPSATLTVTTGVAAANPAAPATPAGEVGIFDVYVPAAAVGLLDLHLMDRRLRFDPFRDNRAHCKEWGITVGPDPAVGTSVQVQSGRASVDGALAELFVDTAMTAASILEPGAPVLAADQEYHLYLLAMGMREAIGKGVANGLIWVLSLTAPSVSGSPSAPITFNPLAGSGISAHTRTTQRALYAGPVHTDDAGNFELYGAGVPLNRGGTCVARAVDPTSGRFPLLSGWLRRPTFGWVDAATLSIGPCSPVLNGDPGWFVGANAAMVGNLAFGEVEAVSTWYYVYLRQRLPGTGRFGAARSYRLVISSEAPNANGQKPTPEADVAGRLASDYLYVGSAYNNGAGDLERFQRHENRTVWFEPFAALQPDPPAIAPARTDVTARIPATSRTALVSWYAQMYSGGAGTVQYVIDWFAGSGYANRFTQSIFEWEAVGAGDRHVDGNIHLEIPVTAAGIFQVSSATLTNLGAGAGDRRLTIEQTGYSEDLP